MKRRNFVLASGSAILTGGFALSQSENPAVGLSFELSEIPDRSPKNVNRLAVGFDRLEITTQYLNDSQDMDVEAKLRVDGYEQDKSSNTNVSVVNGTTKNFSDDIEPIVVSDLLPPANGWASLPR